MKKNRFLFLPWLLVAALCLPLFGCGDDDEKDEPDVPAERQKYIRTFTFDYFKQNGQYLVGFPERIPTCWLIWGTGKHSFMVYLVQSGKIYYTGWADSNENTDTEEERTSKSLTLNVEIPSNINRDMPYDMIALLYNVDATLSNNRIVCNADLDRDNSIYLWNHTGANTGTYSLMTTERLFVDNNTTDTITVRHKGFDAKEKWYYSKATVSLSADMQATGQGSSTSEEVVSEPIKVAPADYSTIWSHYVPTGKKMTDVCLVLEINGKEVKTPPISSDMDIKLGEYYCMWVKWDGKNLEWVLQEDETTIQNIKKNNRYEKTILFDNQSLGAHGAGSIGMW